MNITRNSSSSAKNRAATSLFRDVERDNYGCQELPFSKARYGVDGTFGKNVT